MSIPKGKLKRKAVFFTTVDKDIFVLAESKPNFSDWVKAKLRDELFVDMLLIEQQQQTEYKEPVKQKIVWNFPN